MSISIWMLCDPGLHIPFSGHMENQHMKTPGSDGSRIQGHSCGQFWSGQAVGWLKISHISQDRGHTVLHSRKSCQPAPRGSKPCSAFCCKAMSYNSQNSTDLLVHLFYFKYFYFIKKKKYPRMCWAIKISIFILILFLFLCSITVISLHLPLSLTAHTSKLSIMICGNVCIPWCFSICKVWYESQI